MPTYLYQCNKCGTNFDVTKTISRIDEVESCECGSSETIRCIANGSFEKSSVFEPYYEPTLGCIIKSKSQKADVLRSRGLIEVGNEPAENLYKYIEKPREQRIATSWDNI